MPIGVFSSSGTNEIFYENGSLDFFGGHGQLPYHATLATISQVTLKPFLLKLGNHNKGSHHLSGWVG